MEEETPSAMHADQSIRLASGTIRRMLVLAVGVGLASPASAQEQSTEELAKKAQNPIADLISLPFQSNTNFGVGPFHSPQEILNIQPVIPISINPDWNLITRWITPVISQPKLSPTGNEQFGIGDLNPSLFFSPAKPAEIIWGVGPTFLLPTATDQNLGNHRWGAGPSVVVLTIQGHWLFGALANNIWSFASTGKGSNVNQMLIQPFVNYNFPDGWYLTSSPVITADWLADGRKWTVPVGGGFGRLFKLGEQPINTQVQVFYNVTTPRGGAKWQARLQMQLLFPK
jgi:hypothetical protein